MGKKGPEKWIKEILEVWNTSGWTGRILLVLACIGASTALTSLSQIVLEWKGLIAEMLSFYGHYLRDPIATLIGYVTLGYIRPSGPVIDAVLLYSIYFTAEKRVIGKLSERSVLNACMFIMRVIYVPFFSLIIALLVLFFLDRYAVSGIWVYAEIITIVIPLVMIFWSFFRWIRYLNWLPKGNCYPGLNPKDQPLHYKFGRRDFILFATPMVFAFLVLVLLASINLGLS